MKKFLIPALAVFFIIAAFFAGINIFMVLSTRKYVFTDLNSVPQKYTGIVLGARAYKNNVVSHVFRDRIAGGMELLENKTVSKILISGDHGRKNYDEVNAALTYLNTMYDFKEKFSGSDIFLDHAGFSTYETMYRARDVFLVKDAVIVTQPFHIYRSLYIARKLGIDAVGFIPREQTPFRRRLKLSWELRESLARVKAFFSVVFNIKPTYLGEEIPITGDGLKTRD